MPGSFLDDLAAVIADEVQQLYAKSKLDLSRCRGVSAFLKSWGFIVQTKELNIDHHEWFNDG